MPELTKFFLYLLYVAMARSSGASSFVDDVTFLHHGPYSASFVFLSRERTM